MSASTCSTWLTALSSRAATDEAFASSCFSASPDCLSYTSAWSAPCPPSISPTIDLALFTRAATSPRISGLV